MFNRFKSVQNFAPSRTLNLSSSSSEDQSPILMYGSLPQPNDEEKAEESFPTGLEDVTESFTESSVASSLTSPNLLRAPYRSDNFQNLTTFLTTTNPNVNTLMRTESPKQPSTTNTLSTLDSSDELLKKLSAEQVYIESGNSKQILLTMAYGLAVAPPPHSSTKPEMLVCWNDPLFNQKQKSKVAKSMKRLKPTVAQLVSEVKMRKQLLWPNVPATKTSTQKKVDWYLMWLDDNPRESEDDVRFLRQAVTEFKQTIQDMLKEDVPTNSPTQQWRGDIPWLRLIHALLDDDNIRRTYVQNLQPLSRAQLDNRKNVVDVWSLVADKWNDNKYDTRTNQFPLLHPIFTEPIDLPFSAVSKMGKLKPEMAKKKFYQLKSNLIRMKTRWDRSGNGEGAIMIDKDGNEFGACGDNRSDFLGNYSPAVLYLWEKSDVMQFLTQVLQKLNTDAVADDGETPSIIDLTSPTKRRNKREREEDERTYAMQSKLVEEIGAASDVLKAYTRGELDKNIDTLMQKRFDTLVAKENLPRDNTHLATLYNERLKELDVSIGRQSRKRKDDKNMN